MEKSIFVNVDNTATFICPECHKSKTVDVSDFIGSRGTVKLRYRFKCRVCVDERGGYKNSGIAILERRRYYRKEVSLAGKVVLEKGIVKVSITDLSRTGVRFNPLQQAEFPEGGTVVLKFRLDNKSGTMITKKVRILSVDKRGVGAEFLSVDESDLSDKAIGFYLFN